LWWLTADAAEVEATQGEMIIFGAYAVPVVREVANRIDDVRAATRANSNEQAANALNTRVSLPRGEADLESVPEGLWGGGGKS
jgi:hypothetical protein